MVVISSGKGSNAVIVHCYRNVITITIVMAMVLVIEEVLIT